MTKKELRRLYLEKRKSLSAAERARRSAELAARFFDNFDLAGVRLLHLYLPIERFCEIDTRLILDSLRRDHPRIETLVPRVDAAAGELEHVRLRDGTPLVKNSWQIEEPDGAQETVAPSDVDLVLVPLLCFDRRGYRVGYGKGFYDRFLARCRADCRKIGLSFFPPVDAIEDVHAADVALDFGVAPDRVWRFP